MPRSKKPINAPAPVQEPMARARMSIRQLARQLASQDAAAAATLGEPAKSSPVKRNSKKQSPSLQRSERSLDTPTPPLTPSPVRPALHIRTPTKPKHSPVSRGIDIEDLLAVYAPDYKNSDKTEKRRHVRKQTNPLSSTRSTSSSTMSVEAQESNERRPPERKRKRVKELAPSMTRSRLSSSSLTELSDESIINDERNTELKPTPRATKGRRSPLPVRETERRIKQGSSKSTLIESAVFLPSYLPPGVNVDDAIYIKAGRNIWPAKLLAFEPAISHDERATIGDRFLVLEWGSSIARWEKRRRVLFRTDPRIADLTLGQVKIHRDPFTSGNYDSTREPTPIVNLSEPIASASTPLPSFFELPRIEQMRIIRPHLAKVITEEYSPARDRLDAFYGTRGARTNLSMAVSYGDISENEISVIILPELERWALRRERWRDYADEADRPPEPPRPTGSLRYEALSPAERQSFIFDVLLPEAVVQLVILSEEISLPTEQQTYERAVERLRVLASSTVEVEWRMLLQDLSDARKAMRAELGMAPEDVPGSEERTKKLNRGTHEEGLAGQRLRKVHNYSELRSRKAKPL